MSKINMMKVVVGGLVAGLVMNVIDFITNVPVLGAAWREAAKMSLTIDMEKWSSIAPMGWITHDFLLGILTVWLYAAMRPRFGAGPKTAMIAGISSWLISLFAFASYAFTGVYPASLVVGSSVGALIAVLAGAYVGGMLYKEEAA